ncbi:MAG TPA: sulfotransferase [Anaerolineales bacterium]|nr:sulfotransferase [Anaerolineales bacterium]
MTAQEMILPKENDAAFEASKRTDVSSGYIFIVGLSRSGTTLMRNILNQSEWIAISRENHFLGHLVGAEGMRQKFRKFGDLSNNENVHKLVDHLYSGGSERSSWFRRASSHWRWITRRVDRQDFTQKLLETDRSERAFFILLMQLFAEKKGKPIMGEKTPAHFRYVETLLNWFPEAKIIHMMRDPRGIFVSEWRRRQKEAQSFPYQQLKRLPILMKLVILLQTTITWREGARRCQENQKKYPLNYYTQRFEDLVSEPERQVQEMCAFIGVPFQPSMLEQTVVSLGFQEKQTGFDAGAADRWKKHITPGIETWFRFWLGDDMKKFGYAR